MTDEQDQNEPRKRKHRRASRPATGGDPSAGIPARAGRDDTDAGWAPDAPDAPDVSESDAKPPAKRSARRVESAQDRWWREQRPPHWE
ncbi:hypothetical protein [Flexivirga alba]|uniref:Uncharacterized protein n=1 Tax=Flexivirga alba TaxID=702742 RepID=A0ABW2AAQ2_9MICO